jgi:hypothetical protein
MENTTWVEIIFGSAFGIGFLKLLWDAYIWIIGRKDKLKTDERTFKKNQLKIEELFNDLIASSVKIQELIEQFVINTRSLRVIILRMENGGGMPQLGTSQHMSILYEAIHPDYREITKLNPKPLKPEFQNFDINSDYQKMLLKMILDETGYITETKSHDVDIIKNVHESIGVKKNIILPIVHIPELCDKLCKGFLIYMGIHLTENIEIDSNFKVEYTVLKNKIREIYEEFYIKKLKNFL